MKTDGRAAPNCELLNVSDPMGENKYKVNSKRDGGGSLFSFLEKILRFDAVFKEGLPAKYLPHIAWATALGIFYIGNNHWVERSIRKIDRLQVQVDELRADYTSLKADYMFASKQSEVARKVKVLGLKESLEPPTKIAIEGDEY